MRFHGIEKDSMLNGEGLRVVLWVSGCENKCKGCQNPQTWDKDSGKKFTSDTFEELIAELEKSHIKGLTLSGGDPLYPDNRYEVGQLCKLIKQELPNKDIWLYTGYLFEEVKHLKAIEYTDVLVDGKFVQELADINYPYAGSTNQSLVDVQKSLKSGCKIIYEVVQ